MAYSFKHDGIWHIRYKNEAGEWRRKSCGKKANATDACYLEKEYTSKELNCFHKAPVRIVTSTVEAALMDFRKTEKLDSKRTNNGQVFICFVKIKE